MQRTILPLLFAFLLFIALPQLFAGERITQETKGANSPAQYVAPGGTGTIIYKIDAEIDQVVAEVREGFSKCLEATIAFQTKKVEELNKTLAILLVQKEGISDDDAKKWARDILDKAPKFKKEIEANNTLIKRYNEELSKDLLAKIYKAFVYIIETVDSRLLALKELSPKATYDRDNQFVLFSDETTKIKPYTLRTFVFAHGNRITVILTPGQLKQGLIQTCPALSFIESSGQSPDQSFNVNPHYGGATFQLFGGVTLKEERTVKNIEYSATGKDILTDRFKDELNKTFAEFIELAFTR
jgi:hypothetical protein